MLDHERDENRTKIIGLDLDLAIEVENEARNNGFIYLEETFKTDICEHTIDEIGLIISGMYDTTFMNIYLQFDDRNEQWTERW